MKKLFLTLCATLSILVAVAQEPITGRAFQFHLGEIVNDEIHWTYEPRTVDILVQFNEGEIIVFSEEHQVYQIITEMGRKDGTVMWKGLDKRGSYCWLFMTDLDYNENVALTIRYSDYAWMYICREVK